ncbi:hypothetical protein Bbelb_173830 [Branchiostoma belcheri]|nr:hypothetical protein Bbelb_173830 [Branchiostoma belcheri]
MQWKGSAPFEIHLPILLEAALARRQQHLLEGTSGSHTEYGPLLIHLPIDWTLQQLSSFPENHSDSVHLLLAPPSWDAGQGIYFGLCQQQMTSFDRREASQLIDLVSPTRHGRRDLHSPRTNSTEFPASALALQ